MPELNLSIIIISYNTKKITINCLNSLCKSLARTTLRYEILIIDNGSTDGSVDDIKAFSNQYKEVVFIDNKQNIGFARANNKCAKIALSEHLLFLNSDIIVLGNAVEELYTYFLQNHRTIQFLGGKLLNKDLSPQASCGPFFTVPIVFAFLFLRGDYWSLTRYSPNTIKEVDWVSGACIMTTKNDFNSINGFDEKIFMYMDEIDLLYRAKLKKMRVFFYPKAQFIHLGSASSSGKTFPILQVYKGYIYFYKKHYSSGSLYLLRGMLQLKAVVGIALGKLLKNTYLETTYAKALKIVQMD